METNLGVIVIDLASEKFLSRPACLKMAVLFLSFSVLYFQTETAYAKKSHPYTKHSRVRSRSVGQTHHYYKNSRGVMVHSPVRTTSGNAPAGASARCRDGSYSVSQSRRGTCSHHNGVAGWL